jgi:hypothetical protein
MSKNGRREFLNRTTMMSLSNAVNPAEHSSENDEGTNATAGFGWKISNLNNNNADVYFRVARKMILNAVSIDAAFVVLSPPASGFWAEVLCIGYVNRGGAPAYGAQGPSYLPLAASPDFGTVTVYNPNNLTVNSAPTVKQDVFYSIIMKAWVPVDGTASATSRHVVLEPSLILNAGDYLAFDMVHAGLPGDCEMQVVLAYSVK